VRALWTFKGPQIGVGGATLDMGQHHAALTLWAAWPFDGKQRRIGADKSFRHVMHPCVGAGAQHSQSPMKADGRAVIGAPYTRAMSDR
jgi:hypothetical protein